MLKKTIQLITGITIASCLIICLNSKVNADTKKQTVKNTDKVQHLIIDAPTKVILKTGSEFQVQSKFSNLKKTTITNQNGKLKVSYPHQKHLWGIQINSKQPKSVVTVTIPSNLKLTDLKIKSKAADVQTDAAIKKLLIASHSGDVKLTKTNSKNLTIKSESGDINIDQVKVENDNHLSSESGDVKISNSQFNSMQANSESGDIFISNLIAKTLRLNSDSGNVKINNQKATKYNQVIINSDSGDVEIKNSKINKSKIDTAGGDLDLPKTKINHSENSTE